MPKKKTITHWYFVIILLFVSSLLWFFIDSKSQESISLITAETAAKPIAKIFNQKAIEQLKNRFVIPRLDLAKIEPYTSNSAAKSASINIINEEANTLPQALEDYVASNSANLPAE